MTGGSPRLLAGIGTLWLLIFGVGALLGAPVDLGVAYLVAAWYGLILLAEIRDAIRGAKRDA